MHASSKPNLYETPFFYEAGGKGFLANRYFFDLPISISVSTLPQSVYLPK